MKGAPASPPPPRLKMAPPKALYSFGPSRLPLGFLAHPVPRRLLWPSSSGCPLCQGESHPKWSLKQGGPSCPSSAERRAGWRLVPTGSSPRQADFLAAPGLRGSLAGSAAEPFLGEMPAAVPEQPGVALRILARRSSCPAWVSLDFKGSTQLDCFFSVSEQAAKLSISLMNKSSYVWLTK